MDYNALQYDGRSRVVHLFHRNARILKIMSAHTGSFSPIDLGLAYGSIIERRLVIKCGTDVQTIDAKI